MLWDFVLYPSGSVASKRPGLIASSCTEAWSVLQPGLRRPMAVSQNKSRRARTEVAGRNAVTEEKGSARSKLFPTSRLQKSGGVTLRTAAACPGSKSLLAEAESQPPNALC